MLSTEVSGKAQKYARVGPREFVKIVACNNDDEEDDEEEIDLIKKSCLKHFASRIGPGFECDILEGEQGPSCFNVKQIPDSKLVYIRFIRPSFQDQFATSFCLPNASRNIAESLPPFGESKPKKYVVSSSSVPSCPSPSPKKAKIYTPVPQSISISHMLQLGKVVQKTTSLIDIYKFELQSMSWSTVAKPVEFAISEHVLGE